MRDDGGRVAAGWGRDGAAQLTSIASTRLVLGAVGVAVLLLVGVGVVVRSIRQLDADATWVSHTHAVLADLTGVMSLAQDAETGQRGYIITGDRAYLAPYHDAVAAVHERVDWLQRETADNPAQQARVVDLRTRLDAKLAALEQGVRLRDSEGFAAAQQHVLSGRGKNDMDAVRSLVATMSQLEHGLLRQRSQQTGRAYRLAIATSLLSGVVALFGFAGFLLVLRADLAARRNATRIIAEQGERLRTTLASIGDAVITTDVEGRITNLNAVAESLTGWSTAAAVGQPLGTVFHIVNETTRLPVEQPALRALRDGAIVGLANHTVLIARDGREYAIDDSAAPIRCKEGELVGCVLVFRDISERRRAEAREQQLFLESKAATAQFRAFFDQGALFAGIMHVDGTLLETNRLALEATGFSKEQVLGRPFWECPWWTPSPALVELIKRAVATAAAGATFRAETAYFVADGSQRMVDLIIPPIKDDDGQVLFLAPIGTDITERTQLERELRQLAAELSESGRRKDEFLAMLAHELRNPLAPIRNALAVLRRTAGAGAVGPSFEMLERQVEHMVRLVDDLLDVSRISRGKIELRSETLALATVVQHAVETVRPLADGLGQVLAVSLPARELHVDADPVRLAQVLANLLNNACKFSAPGGRIALGVEADGGDALIRVRDWGTGIAAEHLDCIFEMFTQVDASRERSQSGLGIGLTLVKSLIEMQGGSVTAHSDGIGHGSEFVVRLPLVAAPPLARQPTAAPAALGRRRVLVVDDNRDAAESLAMLLELSGHETRLAFDGEEAVTAAAAFQPEVVLLDIGLPRLNGYDAARRIRQQADGRAIVMVALTGWGQDGDRQQAAAAGFDGHLVKPVDHQTLFALLAELLSAGAASGIRG